MNEQSKNSGAKEKDDPIFRELFCDENGKPDWNKIRAAALKGGRITHEQVRREYLEHRERYRKSKEGNNTENKDNAA